MKCSWWLSAVCFLLAACAARGTGFDSSRGDISRVPEGKARVVFLRTDESLLYSARKARVLIDGEKTGGCALGGFIFRDMAPGEHRLVADTWDAPGRCEVIVTAEAGRIYYFQVDPLYVDVLEPTQFAKIDAIVILGLIRGITPKGQTREQSMKYLVEAIQRCATAAEGTNVRFALEPMNRYETDLIRQFTLTESPKPEEQS